MKYKTALITDASSNVGQAIARKLAAEGCDLILACRSRREHLLDIQSEIRALGVRCEIFCGDLGQEGGAGQLFDFIGELGYTVDILINNASISQTGLFQDVTWEEWQDILAANLTSIYASCKEAIPAMTWNGYGRIINLSSVRGLCGAPFEVAYSATQGAIHALTKALAKELAPHKIPVNTIACGVMEPEADQPLTDEERQALEAQIPAGRLGKPEEVAELVWNLIANGEYLTGQILQLDGGWI